MSLPHIHQLRVYWEDTDAGGIVYHSNYLNFAERARTEMVRDLGLKQSELAADGQQGIAHFDVVYMPEVPATWLGVREAATLRSVAQWKLPGVDAHQMLLDDDGHEVTTLGQPGEIAIKGPQVMAGYWQRPDETAKVMTEDGFFKSGDVGVMDERGYFKIVDRKKDMVLVSGFNVYPNEVEEVVADMPGVLECAVVGVPDEKTGEAVKLVIVKKDPALTEAQVKEYCKANLTGYKQPKVIEFRTELPKTPVGKILRRELRDKK